MKKKMIERNAKDDNAKWKDAWKDGRIDGWKNGWKDGWKDMIVEIGIYCNYCYFGYSYCTSHCIAPLLL